MAETGPAFIAFTASIVVGFASHFVAEDYRRFRDGQAVAAALAGELRSITSALPELRNVLITMRAMSENLQEFPLPEFPLQTSPMFEANTTKVGMLGPLLARDVAFIYDQINAFRTSFHLLSKHHTEMPPAWSSAIVGRCISLIERNDEAGQALIGSLNAYSDGTYLMSRPIWTAAVTAVTITSLSCLFGVSFCVFSVS